jgi:hypothetical protein
MKQLKQFVSVAINALQVAKEVGRTFAAGDQTTIIEES